MNKCVIIIRGTPGNGKSTFAEYLNLNINGTSIICCADDYFMIDDKYCFDYTEIHLAHKYCKDLFKKSIKDNIELIIVANTSTRTKDVNYYRNLAIKNDYKTFVLTLENWHNGQDIHNVPEEAKENMKKQLLASIKL